MFYNMNNYLEYSVNADWSTRGSLFRMICNPK